MLGRSDREILSHVRRALREIGEPHISGPAYRSWRQRELARHDRPLPAVHQLQQRYGSFSEAVQLADPLIRRRRLRPAGAARVASSQLIAGTPTTVPAQPASDTANTATDASISLVVAMAETLTDEELRELERFLRRRLAKVKSPAARRRVKRLHPLAELLAAEAVITKPFALIPRTTYDEKRPADAPTSDTLQRQYGSWVKACRAAGGVKADGRKSGPGRRNLPVRVGRGGKSPSYSRDEVLSAIRACAENICRSLSELSSYDYHQWQIDRTGRLRSQGQSQRLPNYRSIAQMFRKEAEATGTTMWAVAVAAAAASAQRD
jgi:hypothetical protein